MADETAPDAVARTTTIQVSNEIWAALDRRKGRGQSFDDVIRRLIEATGTGVGALEGPAPDVEYSEVRAIDESDDPNGCAYYDVIEAETCDAEVQFKQEYRFADGDETRLFYYCGEHAPT